MSNEMEFGSLNNLLYSKVKAPIPEVGMGATMLSWTDRHPYTIIEVSKSGKRIKVQSDSWERTDKNGLSEHQEYKYISDPNGSIEELSLRKDGSWRVVGGTQSFLIGKREKYYDPSF